jgi:hypothetical protein
MAHTDWMIRGPKIGACNCAYGCPCDFNALPTDPGRCEGVDAMRIEEGWFGDVRLDGLCVGSAYSWPGPVHKGRGTAQGFIDERATPEQRAALLKIMRGEEQEAFTPFSIYNSTIDTVRDTVYARFEFDCDIAARTGRFAVPGHIELEVEPIRNPVTGKPHRALISLPEGFEYRFCEVASGSFRAMRDFDFTHGNRHAVLFRAAYGPNGVLE